MRGSTPFQHTALYEAIAILFSGYILDSSLVTGRKPEGSIQQVMEDDSAAIANRDVAFSGADFIVGDLIYPKAMNLRYFQ